MIEKIHLFLKGRFGRRVWGCFENVQFTFCVKESNCVLPLPSKRQRNKPNSKIGLIEVSTVPLERAPPYLWERPPGGPANWSSPRNNCFGDKPQTRPIRCFQIQSFKTMAESVHANTQVLSSSKIKMDYISFVAYISS